MKKLLIILFSIMFIVSCSNQDITGNVGGSIPNKYKGFYSYGNGKNIIIKDDGKTVINQNGENGTVEKISETEYKIKFANTEITINFGNDNKATIKDENGISYNTDKKDYVETDPNKGIEQFEGTYNSENGDGRYVTINKDGSIIIGVNPEPDFFNDKEKVKYLGESKFSFMAGTEFEDNYIIEFSNYGNRLKLVYGWHDYPLYLKKKKIIKLDLYKIFFINELYIFYFLVLNLKFTKDK